MSLEQDLLLTGLCTKVIKARVSAKKSAVFSKSNGMIAKGSWVGSKFVIELYKEL
jgi:hypothetical protein